MLRYFDLPVIVDLWRSIVLERSVVTGEVRTDGQTDNWTGAWIKKWTHYNTE